MINGQKIGLIIFFGIFTQTIFSQNFNRINFPISVNNTPLKIPLAGGLNTPQYSEADLDGDGIKDLYIFDRTGNVSLGFKKETSGWEYKPDLVSKFPDLQYLALLRDYNGDNIPDLFTFNDGAVQGLKLYKGKRVGGYLTFDPFQTGYTDDILYYMSGVNTVNLYLNSVDIPAIEDIDNDGDLDVLSFEVGGGKVYYYKNTSIERNYRRDSMLFYLEDFCWGRFYDNGLSSAVRLGTRDACAAYTNGGSVALRHPGASIALYDADNDGDKDAVLGGINFSNIIGLSNAGTTQAAWMNAQNSNFPPNTEGVNIDVFPAAYFVDADADGKRDMLVAPASSGFVENYNASWFYKNIGTAQIPAFSLQTKSFLINEMLDLGAGANPCFVDINADGKLDLIVGNGSYFVGNTQRDSRLFYYLNTGTNTNPQFQLSNDNYLNFSALSNLDSYNFSPTFGDLDGDGDLDLLLGDEGGALYYGENTAGTNQAINIPNIVPSYKNIQGGGACKPQIIDLDRDGLSDIVTGTATGTVRFFKNTGTRNNPNFASTATIRELGRVDVRSNFSPSGYAAPFFLDFGSQIHLICGSEDGKLRLYDSIIGNLNGTFRLLDADWGKVREGTRTTPVLANINGDMALEMLVGNQRGGVAAYATNRNTLGTTSVQNTAPDAIKLSIFPNPSADIITLNIEAQQLPKNIYISNILGQIIKQENTIQSTQQIDIQAFECGVYFLNVEWENTKRTVKFVKW